MLWYLKFILFLNFSDPRLRAQRKQVGIHADLQRKLLGGNTDLYFPEMDVDFRTMLHELPMSLRWAFVIYFLDYESLTSVPLQ